MVGVRKRKPLLGIEGNKRAFRTPFFGDTSIAALGPIVPKVVLLLARMSFWLPFHPKQGTLMWFG